MLKNGKNSANRIEYTYIHYNRYVCVCTRFGEYNPRMYYLLRSRPYSVPANLLLKDTAIILRERVFFLFFALFAGVPPITRIREISCASQYVIETPSHGKYNKERAGKTGF